MSSIKICDSCPLLLRVMKCEYQNAKRIFLVMILEDFAISLLIKKMSSILVTLQMLQMDAALLKRRVALTRLSF